MGCGGICLQVLAGLAEEFQLHLLELADTEDEVTGGDLVTEGFSDLAHTEGKLAAGGALDVVEVYEDTLGGLGTEIYLIGGILGYALVGLVHQIEFADGTIVVPETFSDMSASALANLTESRIYTVERDGQMMTFEVTPEYMEDQGTYLVGFSAPVEHVEVGLLQGMADGVSQMVYVTVMMVESILDLFKGQNLDQLSGPVGIYTVTAEQASLGLTNYIWLIGIISLNVGIVNAIPLPVLDGGRVVLTVFEMITGKPINKNVEQALMTVAIVLLLGLMIFATGQDILRLFK